MIFVAAETAGSSHGKRQFPTKHDQSHIPLYAREKIPLGPLVNLLFQGIKSPPGLGLGLEQSRALFAVGTGLTIDTHC